MIPLRMMKDNNEDGVNDVDDYDDYLHLDNDNKVHGHQHHSSDGGSRAGTRQNVPGQWWQGGTSCQHSFSCRFFNPWSTFANSSSSTNLAIPENSFPSNFTLTCGCAIAFFNQSLFGFLLEK